MPTMFALSAVLALPADAVHVWRIPLRVSPETLARCQSLLASDEQARMLRFHFPADQRRYAICRACLRSALLNYIAAQGVAEGADKPAQLRFKYGPNGKPELDRGIGVSPISGVEHLHFNVSHSGDRALLAISRTIVGIDLEQPRALDYDAVARQVLSPQDLTTLSQIAPERKSDTFFRLWVRHEAQAKALGAPVGTHHPEIPVYDLFLGPGIFSALATPIPHPQIQLLGDPQWTTLP